MTYQPDLSFEIPLWEAGCQAVAGLDEAGRGPWAGPVTAAAVILPSNVEILCQLNGVRDSKQMTARQRVYWAEKIQQLVSAWAVGEASNGEIDQLGILPATRLAMTRALQQLSLVPQQLLIDALFLPETHQPQTRLIKGDARCLSIAAASVLAKTARDAVMQDLDRQYPGYGFARHKGYGTAIHQKALAALGPCTIHRQSYRPVADCIRKITCGLPEINIT